MCIQQMVVHLSYGQTLDEDLRTERGAQQRLRAFAVAISMRKSTAGENVVGGFGKVSQSELGVQKSGVEGASQKGPEGAGQRRM